MTLIGTIRSLHRYPVKSMVGEELRATDLHAGGVTGDRAWAARNLEVGEQQGAKKLPGLLGLTAWLPSDAGASDPLVPLIGFPDGATLRADDPEASARVSAHVGKRIQLVPLELASHAAHYRKANKKLDAAEQRRELGVLAGEDAPDLSSFPFLKLVELGSYATPPGTYFDAFPLHLLTTSSLRFVAGRSGNTNINSQRYRPNIVIDSGETDGLIEAGWEDATLEIGECRIRIEARTIRCSMPGRAQALDGIGPDKGVIRAVAEHADRHLGVYASVEKAGSVRVGDAVHLIPARPRPLANRLRLVQRGLIRSAVRYLLRG